MSGTINFGIDLGTTNSLVARAGNGTIEIFKNPSGLQQLCNSLNKYFTEALTFPRLAQVVINTSF